jgi:hypothetical protein
MSSKFNSAHNWGDIVIIHNKRENHVFDNHPNCSEFANYLLLITCSISYEKWAKLKS